MDNQIIFYETEESKERQQDLHDQYEDSCIQSVCVSEEFYTLIVTALACLPEKIGDWAVKRVIFFSKRKCETLGLALTIHGIKNCPKYHGIVILFDKLLELPFEDRVFWVAHEIAHIKLKHAISHGEEEAEKKEKDATDLALKWFKDSKYPKPNILAEPSY